MEKPVIRASLTRGLSYQYVYANNSYAASVWGEVKSVTFHPDKQHTHVTIGDCEAFFWVNKVEWVDNVIGVQTTTEIPEVVKA